MIRLWNKKWINTEFEMCDAPVVHGAEAEYSHNLIDQVW